ncbi:MAG: ABC transporter substrate-binding protein [Betaproteobacteria bacterium]
MLPAISGKLLEFVRELVPGVARAGVLWNPDNPAKAIEAEQLRVAARKLNVALAEFPARTLAEIESSLARGIKEKPAVLVILAETVTQAHSKRIAELTWERRIAVVSNLATHTESGGVLSYQPNYMELNRRVGALAGKILRGALPADLPVELPAKFELLVNKGAAKALGIRLPPSLLLRADRAIE